MLHHPPEKFMSRPMMPISWLQSRECYWVTKWDKDFKTDCDFRATGHIPEGFRIPGRTFACVHSALLWLGSSQSICYCPKMDREAGQPCGSYQHLPIFHSSGCCPTLFPLQEPTDFTHTHSWAGLCSPCCTNLVPWDKTGSATLLKDIDTWHTSAAPPGINIKVRKIRILTLLCIQLHL